MSLYSWGILNLFGSNVLQVQEQIDLDDREVILGILPFFHSFGYTIGLWTALVLGKTVVYHFNPVDAKAIGKLCEEHHVTLVAGTPSFARMYLKACRPEQFKTVKHLILGAEKLKDECYREIKSVLNIEPMQGYGTTELSKNALEALEGRSACLLANHGVIATGPTLGRALWLAGEVETLAKQYVLAQALGEPRVLPDDEIARVVEKFKSYGPKPKDS